MNTQYKKGFMRLAVLSVLSKKPEYGYEVTKILGAVFNTPAATIYPILYKLVDDDLVETRLSDESEGGIRKYYALNEKGKQEYQELLSDWANFQKLMNSLVK